MQKDMLCKKMPRMAYVFLWFPLASETFIFREIADLVKTGVDVRAYTMYGRSLKGCSREMVEYNGSVTRMGLPAIFRISKAFMRFFISQPARVWALMRKGFFRKMRNTESQAENIWCFLAGFLLAEHCKKDNIELIHAAWANGPATAAWVASHLTGIPFGFTGRAGDIYPQDGILPEKSADAVFIRTNNAANVNWLSTFCPEKQSGKIKLVYNGLTFANVNHARVPEFSGRRILAIGRFARTKGFTYLFTAMARLKRENFACTLTLVGDGAWRSKLQRLQKRLGLEDCITFTGFLPNDELASVMLEHDVLVVPSVIYKNGDRDGIPNVIMEASTMELPVVATDVCGISEVISNGKTGYLVPQRNAAALANALRTCLENNKESKQMARAAHNRVMEMFDSQKNTSKLLQLYCDAIS